MGDQVGEADDGIERSAYFVAHVCQKRRFQPVSLFRFFLFATFVFLFQFLDIKPEAQDGNCCQQDNDCKCTEQMYFIFLKECRWLLIINGVGWKAGRFDAVIEQMLVIEIGVRFPSDMGLDIPGCGSLPY